MIGASQVLALLIALPVGVYAATRPYSIFDQIASTFALIGFSLPTFFTGIVFILVFSVELNWLPFVFRSDLPPTGLAWWWAEFRQSIMPVAVLGLFQGATWTRFVRSAVLDVIRLDYVTTARSKGLPESGVVLKHIVRNALIPVVTLIALQMPIVFGGAIVTEQIFRDSRHRIAADQRDPGQRHAGDHGGDVRLRLPGHPVQPDRGPAVWLARPPHLLPLTRATRCRRARRGRGTSRRGPRPGGASAVIVSRWRAP